MLASRPDQENVLALGPGPTKNRALVPKTAGPYPHTPFKVPLNDENGAPGLGDQAGPDDKTAGKANHNGTAARQAFFTPMAGGRRAPLGNKTTNAKARSGHATAAKRAAAVGLDRTASKPAGRWHEPISDLGPLKVSWAQDNADADTHSDESEVEYAPPPEPDAAYESDVLPDGMLTLSGLHADNLLRGYYGYFHDPSAGNDGAENNQTARVGQAPDTAAAQKPAEIDWPIGDMAESRSRIPVGTAGPVSVTEAGARMAKASKTGTSTSTTGSGTSRMPSTLASRKAARALSVLPDGGRGRAPINQTGSAKATGKTAAAAAAAPTATISRALALLPSSKRAPTATAGRVASFGGPGSVATQNPRGAVVSRNTLGYTRGRSASSAVRARPASSCSVASSVRKGPAGSRVDNSGGEPEFLSIFDDGQRDGFHGDDGGGGGGRGGAVGVSFLEDATDFVLRLDE